MQQGHRKQSSQCKLITGSDLAKMDDISYQQLKGRQAPMNTPIDKKIQSPWKNIIIDDGTTLDWGQDVFTDFDAQELTQNTYTRQQLKQMMSQDLSQDQVIKTISILSLRQCRQNIDYREFCNRQQESQVSYQPKQVNTVYLKKQQSQQQQQPIVNVKQFQQFQQVVRSYIDPLVQQKQQEMKEQFKWLEVQKQESTQKISFMKELKFKLNQLAPQNFDFMSNQITQIIISKQFFIFYFQQSKQYLDLAIEQIVDKGTVEDKYCRLYAQVINRILQNSKPDEVNIFKVSLKEIILESLKPQKYLAIEKHLITLDDNNDKLIYQTQRKKRYIGFAKFSGILYLEGVFDVQFINLVIRDLITYLIIEYKEKKEQVKFSLFEEPIEALIQLIQLCGQQYCNSKKQAIENEFIDSISRELIWKSEPIRLSQIGILEIIDCLVNNYLFSQRTTILLGILRELVQNNWNKENIGNKFDLENEKLEISSKIIRKKQEKATLKLTDKDIAICVDQAFKLKFNLLESLIENLFSRIDGDQQWMVFWNRFFSNALNSNFKFISKYKQVSTENLQRVDLAYKIYQSQQGKCSLDLIMQSLNCVLNDYIFDIVESPYGLEFIQRLLTQFIKNYFSCILFLTLLEPIEETQSFMIIIIGKLVSQQQLQNESNIQVLSDFASNNLKLTIEQQQTMWESIK